MKLNINTLIKKANLHDPIFHVLINTVVKIMFVNLTEIVTMVKIVDIPDIDYSLYDDGYIVL